MNTQSDQSSGARPALRAEGLVKVFTQHQGIVRKTVRHIQAVSDVSLTLERGEVLGVVGESGCGKTTMGRLLTRLLDATSGRVFLSDSPDLCALRGRELLPYRRKIQMVFQDPYSSLNPRMTAGAIVAEGIEIHKMARGTEKWERVAHLFEDVELDPGVMRRYPHEFSGGQRQRIGIARALAVRPQVIVADEPVSALDVSVQAQIINLLERLKEEHALSYVFISHDLSVVAHISTWVAVMYLGRIVEEGTRDQVFFDPLHPYTQALLKAAPLPDPQKRGTRSIIEGETPSPDNPPPGCHFHPRCSRRFEGCDRFAPILADHGDGHRVACRLYGGDG